MRVCAACARACVCMDGLETRKELDLRGLVCDTFASGPPNIHALPSQL